MNFPEYWNSVWSDPKFQALDVKTRLFFYAAASQVDQAGWWFPHPQLTPLQIDGIDPKKAAADLSPWVQLHPSGYLSLRGYVAVQAPKGLQTASGFHRGLHKRLLMHQAREVRAGAAPDTVEGLELSHVPSTGALGVAAAVEKVTPPEPQAKGCLGVQSPKSQDQDQAPSPIAKVQAPTGVSEGGQWAMPAQDGETVDTRARPDTPGVHDFALVRATFDLFKAPFKDPEPWVMELLDKAAAEKGWSVVSEAAVKYLSTGPGRSLEGFSKTVGLWMRRACQHPADDRVWITFAMDRAFPEFGLKAKRWRCGHCGYVETRHDLAFLPDHEHAYADRDTRGVVMGPTGTMIEVPRYQECTLCGHQRAPQVLGVAEGEVAA